MKSGNKKIYEKITGKRPPTEVHEETLSLIIRIIDAESEKKYFLPVHKIVLADLKKKLTPEYLINFERGQP